MTTRLPIRIISDLHLAHPASRVKNVRQLEPLLEGTRTMVFNGDTVELRMAAIAPTAMRYRNSLLDLCAEMRIEPILINGNHDPTLGDRDFLELENHALMITHGDALFPEITPWNHNGRRLRIAYETALREMEAEGPLTLERHLRACRHATIHGVLTEANLQTRPQWVRSILHDVSNVRRMLAIFQAWTVTPRRASAFAETLRPQHRFIAIGHTHWPGAWKRNGRIVFNTGSFFPWPGCRAVEVNEDEILFRAVRFDGKFFHPGRVLKRFP